MSKEIPAAVLDDVSRKRGRSHRVAKVFFSRQNRVCLLDDGQRYSVLKVFVHGNLEREVASLQLAAERGIPAPALLEVGEGWLLMEYLEGPLLADILLDHGDHRWVTALTSSLSLLHRRTLENDGSVLNLSDQNPRNYLLTEAGFYLLDLGEMNRETAEAGLGRLFGHILLFDDAFHPARMDLPQRITNAYERECRLQLNRDVLRGAIETEMGIICARRGGEYATLPYGALLAKVPL